MTNNDGTQQTDDNTKEESKPSKPGFAFYTHKEAGIDSASPTNIPSSPIAVPGMTFTPSGGSVLNINNPKTPSNEEPNK